MGRVMQIRGESARQCECESTDRCEEHILGGALRVPDSTQSCSSRSVPRCEFWSQPFLILAGGGLFQSARCYLVTCAHVTL